MKVIPDSKQFYSVAENLAGQFGFSLQLEAPKEIHLLFDERGLWLRSGESKPLATQIDFVSGPLSHRRHFGGDRNSGIGKAVGANRRRNLNILDMTAGLARDAFVLAGLGNSITLLERNAVLVALLQDGFRRAQADGDSELQEVIERMQLIGQESLTWLSNFEQTFDVIYLDPMFPQRRKSANVKKEMQLLQLLHENDSEQPSDNESQLLSAALEKARYRVVVKRPRIAPSLSGVSPSFAVTGKSSRYDVYALQSMEGG